MEILIEVVVSLLLVIAGVFGLAGSYGLAKLPNLMTRLHAPTKSTTLGVGSSLLASMVYFSATRGGFSAHELLITMFLFLTAPITANMIAKAYLHRENAEGRLPPTGRPYGWATFDAPPSSDNEEPDSVEAVRRKG